LQYPAAPTWAMSPVDHRHGHRQVFSKLGCLYVSSFREHLGAAL
jgi:hypothetical protein